MSYNPDYKPTGPNNRSNEYYKKINHVRIARSMASRSEFYGSPISVAPGGVAPSAFAYTEGMRLDAHPDFAALTDTANWQTETGGAVIDFAGFLVDGSVRAGGYFVQTGEAVTLLVTDTAAPISQYEYTIDASVDAFILTQPQPVDIMEGSTAVFSLSAPTASTYMWEYSTDGTVWQQGLNSNLQLDYPDWTGTASDASVGNTWQITEAHVDMDTMLVRCYLNGGAFITNEVSLSVTDVLEQPAVITDASITGNPVVGQTSTGTPATFSGGMVTVTNKWQDSLRSDGGWVDTGVTGTTSPPHEADMYYRMVSTGDNGVGTPAVSNSNVIGPIVAAETITVLAVTGPQVGGDLPVAYAVTGDTGIAWGIGTGVTLPTAAELRAGTFDGAVDFGTAFLTVAGGPINVDLADGINETGLNLWAVTDSSNDVVQAGGAVPFDIDTTLPGFTDPDDLSPWGRWRTDGGTITDNAGAITSWAPSSGPTAPTFVPDGANTLTTGSTVNGRNAILSDNRQDRLLANGVTDFPGDEFTIFWVGSVGSDDGSTVAAIYSWDTTHSFTVESGVIGAPRLNATSTRHATLGPSIDQTTATPIIHVYRGSITSNEVEVIIGGVRAALGTDFINGMTATGDLQFNTHRPISRGIHGTRCEFIVYPAFLSTDDLNNVGNWLATHWGVPWTEYT